ncbi:MAG: efflux RND transporter periplasmic adaptor subunit [Candidatus Omnitrophica bacterium]|nr:efflux RND transporter periplasmic adaptor subunit [Candidatus Omnitrophota bacterium]
MNSNNKTKLIAGIILAVVIVAAIALWKRPKNNSGEVIREINPHMGSIQTLVSSTGSVLPKNRLELIPPVAGRIESILVKEGDKVKKGQTLGWLSSTERAALLDAAQGQGEEKLKYWQEVYKAIALIAPIDGEVIVATIQPGQTVTTSTAALVLSDKLIVRADVDETDIGKIKVGQQAIISLDAYPEEKIKAAVEHIYYESTTVNNVTIYKVDILPEEVPVFFRSGMNANIDFVVEDKQNVMLIPQEAVTTENNESYVLMRGADGKELVKNPVTLGITQDKNVEIVSGLRAEDTVIVKSKKYELPKSSALGKNPFMPTRKQNTTATSGGKKKTSGNQGPPPM